MPKISALTVDTTPTTDDLIVTVDNPAGTPVNKAVAIGNLPFISSASGSVGTSNLANGSVTNAKLVETVAIISSTGVTNDYSFGPGTIQCTNSGTLTLTGVSGGSSGQVLRIIALGGGQVDIAHQDSRSLTANRFANFCTSGPTSLSVGGTAIYQYLMGYWRLIYHEQGYWISVPYNASDYTPDTGTWTVDAGDVTTYKYYLSGRTLAVNYYIIATTVSGSPNSLSVKIPSTYTIANYARVPGVIYDGSFRPTFVSAIASANTVVSNQRQDLATFANNTNVTQVYGSLTFEVN